VATVETAPAGFVRQDGKEKVTGTGRYTADLSLTGMAYAKFRYADHTHAKILRIDTSKAKALPGVVAVVTQGDLPDVRYGGFVQDRYLFAKAPFGSRARSSPGSPRSPRRSPKRQRG
jgi:CO/xanthine dehydrogenase Mo-binding subunit